MQIDERLVVRADQHIVLAEAAHKQFYQAHQNQLLWAQDREVQPIQGRRDRTPHCVLPPNILARLQLHVILLTEALGLMIISRFVRSGDLFIKASRLLYSA